MHSHFVDSGRLRLHVVEYGGDGPPLLAVHGTGLVAQVWGVMAPLLTPHFRVYALDRRGHGDSDKPESGYELEESVGDYAAVVRHFGGSEWVAIGHSSGGTSLGIAAGRLPLFRRFAMVDPIVFPRRPRPADPPTPGAAVMVDRTSRRRAEWPSAQEMFDSLSGKPPFNTWRAEALWDYVNHGAARGEDGSVTLKCPPALEAQMYRHASNLDLFEEFGTVDVPVLIIRGERTDRFPRANAERAAAVLPHGRLVEMPGLTHFPAMEDPEAVAALVVPFLQGQD